MNVYYITVFIVIVFCVLAQQNDIKSVTTDFGGKYRHSKRTMYYYLVVAGILIFVAGMRYAVGTDFFAYYSENVGDEADLLIRFKTLNEPGFYFISWIVRRFGGDGPSVIFVSSMITIGLFAYTIYRNTNRLLMANLLFIFLGCWHGSFNGVRQYLAASIVFAGIQYIKRHEFGKYCLVIGMASLFHSSAILMLFAYFIVHNKVNLRNILIMVGGSIIILSSFEQVMKGASIILDTEYSDMDSYITQSVNALRVIVAIVPAIFFLIMYWKKRISEEQRLWINFLILNAIMMFTTSNSTYLARMGIYTAPFLTLAIPELIKGLNYNNRKVLSYIIPIMYAFFWWYEVSQSGSLNNFQFIWQR